MLKKIISLLTGNKKETPAPLSPTVAKKKSQEPIAAAPKPEKEPAMPEPVLHAPKPEAPATVADAPMAGTPVVAVSLKAEAVLPPVDLSKFVRSKDKFLTVNDYGGALKNLPDDFFTGHENVEGLALYIKNVAELPASVNGLKKLKSISLYCAKFKQLPGFVLENKNLENLHVHCPQMRLDEYFSQLKSLEHLRSMALMGYYGNKWPTVLESFLQLRQLTVYFDDQKTDQVEMLRSIGRMKWLEELDLRGQLNLAQIGGEITLLDHLARISTGGENPQSRTDFLHWGLLRHVSFHRLNYRLGEMTFDDFKAAIQHDDFDDDTRKLLFGIYAKNGAAAKAILPNRLLEAQGNGQSASFYFAYKPAKDLLNRAKEQGGSCPVRLFEQPGADSFYIISHQNQFGKVLELLRSGKKILLEDHLKEWLTAAEDPWLRQTESQEASEQVYRLLTSNQAENYLLAFQIIEGGGANEELVSMIAAIMLSHPEQKVAKAAEKLFAKLGPSNALTVFKQKKISLRRSGNTVKSLNRLFQTDIGILATPFRLMHGLIAGENPVIKDVQPGELSFKDCQFNEAFPDCARFFEQFTSVDFSRSKGLDVAGALRNIVHWPALNRLDFSGCHCQIPASIGGFRQLTHLDLSSNILADAPELTSGRFGTEPLTSGRFRTSPTFDSPTFDLTALGSLTNLVELSVEGCKIKSWHWLEKLENLEALNMARNELAYLPKELAGLKGLRSLSLSQNKLKSVEEGLFSLYFLSNLDLSNNQISELDYRLFSKLPLDKLSLRSNKISEFDPAKVMVATGGSSCGVWELNLASNALTDFRITKNLFSRLSILDISKNKISALDDGIFQFTAVKNLFASDNQIAEIPPSIAGKYLQKLFLDKNRIAVLPAHFSTAHIENCDLRFNQIEHIPDSFKRKDKGDFSRLYWKLDNNPVGRYSLGS